MLLAQRLGGVILAQPQVAAGRPAVNGQECQPGVGQPAPPLAV